MYDEKRDLDADITQEVFGWKLTKVGPDYDGKNACEILTPLGDLEITGMRDHLPRRGLVHRGFMAPRYSSDLREAIQLANHVGLHLGFPCPLDPFVIAKSSLDHFRSKKAQCPTK